MHTTQELWQAWLSDPVLTPLMPGVFPRDRLPVINGFFRSYGFPPETYNMDTYILREVAYYNDKPLQRLNSDVCGDYCLFYLIQRERNVDVNTIQAKFKGHDSQWNDAQVARSVNVYFNSVIYLKVHLCFEQGCKSFRSRHKQ